MTLKVSRGWVVGPLVIAAAVIPQGIDAQSAVVRLTVESAVQQAVEHAPRMTEADAREAAARANWSARRAVAWPTASLLTSYQRANHIEEIHIPDGVGGSRLLFPDITNYYRVRGEVTVPIYAFGRVEASMDSAHADVEAAGADRNAVAADVRLEATRAYWTLVTARESVRVIEASLTRTDAYVADVKARVDSGVLPPNDVLSAQAQRARQAVRLIQARNDAALAEIDLARLIGAPPGSRIEPITNVGQPVPGVSEIAAESVADLTSRASKARPEHTALDARGKSLRSAATVALANVRPYLVGTMAGEPARPNLRFAPPIDKWLTSWSMGVSMTWPIFDSGRSRAEAASLTAQATAIDARRQDFDELVAVEVQQRLLDLEAGRASIAASAEGVTAATEARRVVEERFRAGVATSTEVLDAQVALLEAELEQTRLQASLRLSEARLLRAVGGR